MYNRKRFYNKILIIDGYNVINAWPELEEIAAKESLESARVKLGDLLSEYGSYHDIYVMVIYDAYRVKISTDRRVEEKSFVEIFTKEGETADTYIENLVTKLGKKKYLQVQVATDDLPQQQIVIGSGATRLSTVELKTRVKNSKKTMRKNIQNTLTPRPGNIMELVDDDVRKRLEELRKSKKNGKKKRKK